MLEYVKGPCQYYTSGYSTPKIMHMNGDLLYLNDVNYPTIHPSWWLYWRRSDRTIPSSHKAILNEMVNLDGLHPPLWGQLTFHPKQLAAWFLMIWRCKVLCFDNHSDDYVMAYMWYTLDII